MTRPCVKVNSGIISPCKVVYDQQQKISECQFMFVSSFGYFLDGLFMESVRVEPHNGYVTETMRSSAHSAKA